MRLLDALVGLYTYVLLGRLILEYVQLASRTWRPTGVLLLVSEMVFTLTDPPLRFLRRVLPPLRLGGVALDLSYIVLLLGLQLLLRLLHSLG